MRRIRGSSNSMIVMRIIADKIKLDSLIWKHGGCFTKSLSQLILQVSLSHTRFHEIAIEFCEFVF